MLLIQPVRTYELIIDVKKKSEPQYNCCVNFCSVQNEGMERGKTLVFSATLIRDFQWRKREKNDKVKKEQKKKKAKDKAHGIKAPAKDDESVLLYII